MIGQFAARAGMAWSARAAATAAVSRERQREPTRLAMSILHRHKWRDCAAVPLASRTLRCHQGPQTRRAKRSDLAMGSSPAMAKGRVRRVRPFVIFAWGLRGSGRPAKRIHGRRRVARRPLLVAPAMTVRRSLAVVSPMTPRAGRKAIKATSATNKR
jgi:hypothetical protein